MSLIRRVYYTYFSKDRALCKTLKETLGYHPTHLYLYKTAFQHKSYINESSDDNLESNERLEYLGDAILNSVIAEYLYKKYPLKLEGFLTKMRSKIVKRSTLNRVADEMELDVLLRKFNNTKISDSMLGNAFEALIGAIYLDRGYSVTKIFIIRKVLQSHLDLESLEQHDDNYKSRLLEWSQKNNRFIEYKVAKRYKRNNRDRFIVELSIDGKVVSEAEDYNKKGAEQKSSKLAIAILIDD